MSASVSFTPWPPTQSTTVQKVIPAYLYSEYADDENLQAFVSAYNKITQQYLDWFNNTPLGVYTLASISGALLDWVAEGVYGIIRPTIPYGSITSIGPLNTWPLNTIPLNTIADSGAISVYVTTDDIFKRIITWHFFKGDGQQFSVPWLKRRIMRFLVGMNGAAPNIDETYQISVAFGAGNAVTITVTWSASITLLNAQIFQAAVADGVLETPFQFAFTVNLVGALTSLTNVGGNLNLVVTSGWPTSSSGLGPGQLWWDGTNINVVAGSTINPAAPPLQFGSITSLYLLLIGGANIQTTNPGAGTDIVWNSSGKLLVA